LAKADYEIQVGAFNTYEEAQCVFQDLQHRSAAAYITPRVGPLGRYYRVRVGPFPTEEKALETARLLKRQGYRIFLDEVPEDA
jgi:cell division septation protein DedD